MCDSKKDENSLQVCEKCEYTWTFDKVVEIKNKYANGTFHESPLFPKGEAKYIWKLRMYPNGISARDFVSVYLCPSIALNNVAVKFTFNLLSSEDKLIIQRDCDHIFVSTNLTWGYSNFVSHDTVNLSIHYDDVLKLHVVIEVLTTQPYVHSNQEKKSLVILSHDLDNMYRSNKFVDFIIKLNDKTEIPVHRAILAARSPVFAAMFEYDVSENNSGFVKITDIDKNTMTQLLTFIYTGELRDLSQAETMKLLTAADKYEVVDLKERCSHVLKNCLMLFNVLDILILAELHNVRDLKQCAFEFILDRSSEFSDGKRLEKVTKYPALLIELVSKIFNSSKWEHAD